ncbi:MAG: hypothetical protein HGA98_04985, partial [Deltaproteobacteria bacterium]|nr:hypothetical protein [Deltaproteobacteria bacterium]
KYQDPLNPTSQEDFLAQTAQFSTVEQLIKLNTQMDGVSSSSRVSAAALIGKKVEGTVTLDDGSTTTVSGVVSQVEYDSAGSLTLGLQGGAKMAFSDVETISQN